MDDLSKRAHRLAESLDGDLEGAHVRKTQSVGGRRLDARHLDAVVGRGGEDGRPGGVRGAAASPAARRCSVGSSPTPSLFDVRTVFPEQLPDLTRAIQYALEGDDFDED